jgi:hypothetical protein
MSEVILCQVPRAEQPFYAEDIDLKLYSIEELCYFMQGHPALLDRDFFGPAMTDWLGGELRLHRLAETLEKQRAGGAGPCGSDPAGFSGNRLAQSCGKKTPGRKRYRRWKNCRGEVGAEAEGGCACRI